jgi:hypothetical protein
VWDFLSFVPFQILKRASQHSREIILLRGSDDNKRVRGIEPPCAAWEAAVLPLNYTREEIFDFRFAIAECNRNKFELQIAVACAVLSASSRHREARSVETADATAMKD